MEITISGVETILDLVSDGCQLMKITGTQGIVMIPNDRVPVDITYQRKKSGAKLLILPYTVQTVVFVKMVKFIILLFEIL